jgi:hypothetical protein
MRARTFMLHSMSMPGMMSSLMDVRHTTSTLLLVDSSNLLIYLASPTGFEPVLPP